MKVKRYDFGAIKNVTKDKHGFLRVPAFLTRAGVFQYLKSDGTIAKELRHPDDVFSKASLDTLKMVPVTNEHPASFVNADNAKEIGIGYTGENISIVNNKFIKANLTITDAKSIKDVENGKIENSCGYTVDLVAENGVYDGEAYDYRQRNIDYNHVAIVDKGRAGNQVKLKFDSNDVAILDQKSYNYDNEFEALEFEGKLINFDDFYGFLYEKDIRLDPFPNEHAARIKDPDQYDRFARVSGKKKGFEQLPAGVSIILGIKGNKSEAQSYRFNKNNFTVAKAKKWLKDNNIKFSGFEAAKKDKEDEFMKVKIGDKEIKFDDEDIGKEVQDGLNALIEGYEKQIDEDNKEKELKKKTDKLQAKVDTLEDENKKFKDKKEDEFKKELNSRVNLFDTAKKICDKEIIEKLDDLSNLEIKKEIIAKHSDCDLKDKSEDYVNARYDFALEIIEKNKDDDLASALLGKKSNDGDDKKVDYALEYEKKMHNAYKNKKEGGDK